MGINCKLLKETSELISRLTNVQVMQNKAVVGENCFAHEAGLAVAGIIKGSTFNSEAYIPELVGQHRVFVLGKKSGRQSVEMRLKEKGITFSDDLVRDVLLQVKATAVAQKRALTDDEFDAIVEKCRCGCLNYYF